VFLLWDGRWKDALAARSHADVLLRHSSLAISLSFLSFRFKLHQGAFEVTLLHIRAVNVCGT